MNKTILVTASFLTLFAAQVDAQTSSWSTGGSSKQNTAPREPGRAAGLPSAGDWSQKWTKTTSSEDRTYIDRNTGQQINYNPKSKWTEVGRSRVTGEYEVTVKENQTIKYWSKPADNGIPSEIRNSAEQITTPETSSNWRTYDIPSTGQRLSFDPDTSRLWLDPTTGRYKPIERESANKSSFDNLGQKALDAFNAGAGEYGTARPSPSGAAPAPQSKPSPQGRDRIDEGFREEAARARSGGGSYNFNNPRRDYPARGDYPEDAAGARSRSYSTGTGHQGDPIHTIQVEEPAPARQVSPPAPITNTPSFTPHVPPAPRPYTNKLR